MTADTQEYSLADRWSAHGGPMVLTGVQAVARVLIEQNLKDRRAGLRTASFVSGYQGSPLGGLDKMLASHTVLREQHDMTFVPGLNEELAATAVWGSQWLLPDDRGSYDGVVGVWYGKSPGVDRTGDAFRHGNLAGASPTGGVLVLAGDDPAAKSSTVPSASEPTLAALSMPVLFPRNAEEVISLGLHGIAMSRASGCWTALKIVADVADGLWTVDASFRPATQIVPQLEWQGHPWTFTPDHRVLPPHNMTSETNLAGPRWEMVRAFADANPVDVIEVDPASAWLGIVAVGSAYDNTVQALHDLGLDRDDLQRAGVRLMRVGMPYPLGRSVVRRLARGLEEILVVEEKGPFVETQVRDVLYGGPDTPSVWGKRYAESALLIPGDSELTATRLAAPLRSVLGRRLTLAAPAGLRQQLTLLPAGRVPYFCSGCPHNRSTRVPDGSVAGGGIGCHAMASMGGRPEASVTGLTQMGGEGAQWIGAAPFVDTSHIFQNLGDGTFFHSGQLAIQACVAAGVNITFKLLHNSTVAMTGGQDATGALDVPAIARKLLAERVARVLIVAEDPKRYRCTRVAAGVQVWHRDRLDEAQRLLRDIPGVTVLIYDQQCAAEARRLRKRGAQPVREQRVLINEQVCEGCGDCGVKSNCLSVQPVDTELGRKTRIDQDSCNTDYSCLDGDCPSFVTVRLRNKKRNDKPTPKRHRPAPPEVPAPLRSAISNAGVNILLAGIGGTGIVTVNQVLATAALLDGIPARGLDQTGLSQKAGPVTSHLRLGGAPNEPANRLGARQVDCYLVFDLVVGTEAKLLAAADPSRTRAFVSTSATPTGAMVRHVDTPSPPPSAYLALLADQVMDTYELDALAAARALFGSTAAANLLLVGAAYQSGALPLTSNAIEQAIRVNGVAVEANIAAFRWGRASVHDPKGFAANWSRRKRLAPTTPSLAEALLAGSSLDGETRRLAGLRADLLVAYQNQRLAKRYLALVERAWAAEHAVCDDDRFSQAVAKGLHKLMAYKDEYEVARLLADRGFLKQITDELPGATRVKYRLHPPALRAMGLQRKLKLGASWRPALRVLAHGKRLRGTPFDPFGRAQIRTLERQLLAEYEARVATLTATLTTDNYEYAIAVAQAPDLVRGYEEVKVRAVDAYRQRLNDLDAERGLRSRTVQ